MSTSMNLRKQLDRKVWEACAPYSGGATQDSQGCESTQFDQLQLWLNGTYAVLYDAKEDSWQKVTDNPVAQSAGYTNITYLPSGPTGTATAGSTTSLATNLTIPMNLVGYTFRITGGTGAGQERVIARSSTGANAVLVPTVAFATAPDATSTYTIFSGRFWVFTASGPAFRYYDVATNTWSAALSVTNIAAFYVQPWLSGASILDNVIASGTATSATGTTLVNSGKAWATNQWANSQVRITGGTGAGQIRTVVSNTGTTLTVATWTTTPDATSTYALEENTDTLYMTGNGLVIQKYTISTNTWTTALTPTVARTSAMASGTSASFLVHKTSDASWLDETNVKSGRYIYSFSTGNLAIYDIALNTWNNVQLAYGRSNTANNATYSGFSPISGGSWTIAGDHIYYMPPVSNNPPFFAHKFNIVSNALEPWTFWVVSAASGGGTAGGKITVGEYKDGATTIRWIYFFLYGNSPSAMYRQLIV